MDEKATTPVLVGAFLGVTPPDSKGHPWMSGVFSSGVIDGRTPRLTNSTLESRLAGQSTARMGRLSVPRCNPHLLRAWGGESRAKIRTGLKKFVRSGSEERLRKSSRCRNGRETSMVPRITKKPAVGFLPPRRASPPPLEGALDFHSDHPAVHKISEPAGHRAGVGHRRECLTPRRLLATRQRPND